MGDRPKRNVILDRLFGARIPRGVVESLTSPHTPAGDDGFRPFGYRFEVRSRLPPAAFKDALRSRMKDWFDARPGARGWIVGPFMCLWFDAFNRSGPMLLAMVRRDDRGTTAAGTAGSNLNGLAAFSVLMPVLAFLLHQMLSAGDYTPRAVITIGGIVLASPLIFWLYHLERHAADPLVRFVQDAAARAEGRGPAASIEAGGSRALTLTTDRAVRIRPTPEDIHGALLMAGEGDFVILAAAEQTYIQAAFDYGGYRLERRDGGDEAHFRALRDDDPSAVVFTLEETSEAFMAWAEGKPPRRLVWEPMRLAL